MQDFEKTLPYWPFRTFNWNRWPNDRGTLNLLNSGTTRRAIDAVRSSEVFAIGAPLRVDDIGMDAAAFKLEMVHAGEYDFGPEGEPVLAASDVMSCSTHGMTNSHIDALCHAGHHGKSFNGSRFADNVTFGKPAARLTVMEMPAIVARAWFVDVAAQRGLPYLSPGSPVVREDLEWLRHEFEPGDAIVIRTGRYATSVVRPDDPAAMDDHGNWCGLHVDCMDFVANLDAAVVATDSSGDNFPSTTPECSVPIHILCEVYLGLPLIHHLNLETLGSQFAGRPSRSFMLCVAPLLVCGGTGSVVNPIAIL